MLTFDAATTALLETAYHGADFVARRRANFDALGARPGETVLDLGCGTGLLTLDLARAVGPTGRAIGLDLSPAMLVRARASCAALPQVALIEAPADATGLAPGSVDRAVSVQCFEYFTDLAPPLSELHRILRPGGRLVIGDMHFGSGCWHSENPARMAQVLGAYDTHLAHRDLPERLAPALVAAGFRPMDCRPLTFVDTHFRPDGLTRMMSLLLPAYIRQNDLLPEALIEAWLAEQEELAARGAFFFSITHFVWIAEKA
ncbi:methyltransferase domain-containing protein [Mesobacterium pallidum]|uniref:methyltransferase domain-containing protein n=1 Tax=Mesobacterium pallidum TaxID=2872037 RepID=UPI001EE20692|nr:methyltransferase domain-containing protein [Mesobacterium pallidum]